MRNKVFYVGLVLAVATVIGWNYSQREIDVEMSDLAKANVEALARGEDPVDPNEGYGMKKTQCYYPNGNVKGQYCDRSPSPNDRCHYRNDVWGNCN